MHLTTSILTRPFRLVTWNQDLADKALAIVIAAAALFTAWRNPQAGLNAVTVPLLLLQTLPVAWRRRDPMRTLGIVGFAITAYYMLDFGDALGYLGVFVAFYTVAAHEPRRRAILAGALSAGCMFVSLVSYIAFNPGAPWPEIFGQAYVWFGVAWLLGDNMRVRRAYALELQDRAAEADKEKLDQASMAVIEERGRIARELHDVVAHYVSVMVVQATAARRVADKDPAAARGALAAVESAGRTALTEMRRMLEVLRADDPGMGPQPGLGELDRLVDQVRGAGLPVELEIKGKACCLPAGMDLAAYRIVQEALTNSVKHAGKATSRVTVTYSDHALEIEVVDDGRGAAAPLLAVPESDGGHGLIGMKERVALFGGQLVAGPILTGGYRVYARMPIDVEDSAHTRSQREASLAAMRPVQAADNGEVREQPEHPDGIRAPKGPKPPKPPKPPKAPKAAGPAGNVRTRGIPPMIVRMLPPHPAEQRGSGDGRTQEGDL
jgi:signal transduction histidine kinase